MGGGGVMGLRGDEEVLLFYFLSGYYYYPRKTSGISYGAAAVCLKKMQTSYNPST